MLNLEDLEPVAVNLQRLQVEERLIVLLLLLLLLLLGSTEWVVGSESSLLDVDRIALMES